MGRLRTYYSLVPSCEGSSEVGFCELIVTLWAKLVCLTAATYLSPVLIEYGEFSTGGRPASSSILEAAMPVLSDVDYQVLLPQRYTLAVNRLQSG